MPNRRSSGRAERPPLVGQGEVGVEYRGRRLALEYRHVVRGREYTAEPAAHAYDSITLTALGFRPSERLGCPAAR